jgi:hypothetical protein
MLNFSDKQFTSIYALYDKIKTKQNQVFRVLIPSPSQPVFALSP